MQANIVYYESLHSRARPSSRKCVRGGPRGGGAAREEEGGWHSATGTRSHTKTYRFLGKKITICRRRSLALAPRSNTPDRPRRVTVNITVMLSVTFSC